MKKTYALLICLAIILALASHYALLNQSFIRFGENANLKLLLAIKAQTGLTLSEKSLAIIDIFLLLFSGSATGYLLSHWLGLKDRFLKNCPRWFFLIPHGLSLFYCFMLLNLDFVYTLNIPISSPIVITCLFLTRHLFIISSLFTWLYFAKKPQAQLT